MTARTTFDAVIVGTGIGGSTFAYALARRGLDVAVIERGDYLKLNTTDHAPVHNHFFEHLSVVGGQTKSFGAAMYRLRESDFIETQMENGVSPAWPIDYAELEPYYCEAEKLYRVHGSSVNDPTEPPRSQPWPHDPIPHQGPIAQLVDRVSTRTGVPVAYVPRAIDYDPLRNGKCVLCRHCDAYYCPRDAKMDAEVAALRPAVATGRVTLLTNTHCLQVVTSPDGRRATGVVVRGQSGEHTINAGIVAVCAGLTDTPLTLWRSRSSLHPNGLANGSGSLGRYWASHTQRWVFLLSPGVQRKQFHQKTFAINSFYGPGPDSPYPMGVIQAAGNIEPIGMSRRHRYVAQLLIQHSLQTFVMTGTVPTRETGFALSDSGATVMTKPIRNTRTFETLRKKAIDIFRAAGYRVFAPAMEQNFHNTGTARMGSDPSTSIVNGNCEAHDVRGLYVVDSSVLPTSGALNSGLTIAAVALRAAARAALPS